MEPDSVPNTAAGRDVTDQELNKDIQINPPASPVRVDTGSGTVLKSSKDDGSSRQSKVKQQQESKALQNQSILALNFDQTLKSDQEVRLSKNDIRGLRKSRDQLHTNPNFVQTHANALRVSKDGALEYKRRDEELTARDEDQQARASSSSANIRRCTASAELQRDSHIAIDSGGGKVSFAEEKFELQ